MWENKESKPILFVYITLNNSWPQSAGDIHTPIWDQTRFMGPKHTNPLPTLKTTGFRSLYFSYLIQTDLNFF